MVLCVYMREDREKRERERERERERVGERERMDRCCWFCWEAA